MNREQYLRLLNHERILSGSVKPKQYNRPDFHEQEQIEQGIDQSKVRLTMESFIRYNRWTLSGVEFYAYGRHIDFCKRDKKTQVIEV